MTDTAIRVENLGKRYKLGAAKSGSFRESMSKLFQRNGSLSHPESNPIPNTPSHPESNPTPKDFWALQDINFEIKRGEAVGIIGRNGAGKSTLLKILSRITEPTTGRYEIFGRVSSLLEVGTGFHPELTGRENVYLNGTILGMKRREVKAKFDEIVAFSGVEKFIDTPVKHYSSGMQVRLAFAVAAHLEPEILIIDEVLAVGDAEFQKKCLGKMEDVTGEGRTVLFVSHNMGAVSKLCSSGILLQTGRVELRSHDMSEVIKQYFDRDNKTCVWEVSDNQYDNEYFSVEKFGIYDGYGNPISTSVSNNEDIWVAVNIILKKRVPSLEIGYCVTSEAGDTLYYSYFYDSSTLSWEDMDLGYSILAARIPKRFFNNGFYSFSMIGGLRNIKWFVDPRLSEVSVGITFDGSLSKSKLWQNKRSGVVAPIIDWKIVGVEALFTEH